MKNLSLFIALILFSIIQLNAQPPVEKKTKSIHVSGSSEMEVTPDEIYITIVLEEYIAEKDKQKTSIETFQKELQQAVASAGIPKENLMIENVYGQNWVKKTNQKDFLEKKSFILKLSDPTKLDQILDKVDQKAIENVYISKVWHSKIEEFRKQLKIQAIKNAKEKAVYLLEAIGEQAGGAIHISEYDNPVSTSIGNFWMDENQISNNDYRQFNAPMNTGKEDLDIKKIKLRMEIQAEFEIK